MKIKKAVSLRYCFFTFRSKVMKKEYLEKCLPGYLERDLKNLKEGLKNKVSYLDC